MKNAPKMQIVKIDEAPIWHLDNEYLMTGYRKNFTNLRKILRSGIMKHNELLNIWTHLIGAIIFIAIFVYLANTSSLGKFDVSQLQRRIENMYGATNKLVSKFRKEIDPIMFNLKPALGHLSSENFNGKLEKYKSALLRMKEDYKRKFLQFKGELEKKEVAFIHSFGNQFDNCLTRLDDLQTHIQSQYANNSIKESEGNGNENIKEEFADDEESGILKSAIDGLIVAFDKIIPGESSVNYFFEEFETYLEIYPFFIFLASAIFCLMSSAIFHWFYPISKTIFKILHKLDLAGVSILNFGSTFAMFYYYFYCIPTLRLLYCSMSFVFCFGVFIVSMGDIIHTPKYLKWKAIMYAGLGLSNIIPITHVCVLAFLANPLNDNLPFNSSMSWVMFMGALYLIGLVFYTLRIPERYYPSTFDIWFNSHTIWHVFVFLAALAHFYAIILTYRTRLQFPCLA